MWIQQSEFKHFDSDSTRKTILLSEATIYLNDILYNNIYSTMNDNSFFWSEIQIPLSRIKQFIIIFFEVKYNFF